MADRLTTKQLNSLSKDELVFMMISMQDRVATLSSRLGYLTEQIAISNNRQFRRKTEKLDQIIGQRAFDAAGNMYFNEAEALIRGVTIGWKNWMMIDTVSGAKVSAVIMSLVKTAKLNGLNPYYCFVHLLKELPIPG